MKRKSIFFALGLGLMSLTGIAFGATRATGFAVAKAESEDAEPAPEAETEEPAEVFECKVILNVMAHGKVSVDKTEGHVGDIVEVTADPDMFYLIDYAEVNGSAIIEDEEVRGLYKFALVEGDNRVTIRFVIDQKLLGEMSIIMDQALSKDWTHLFSVENVLRIVTFLLNGGLLLAIVRYFIKDKRLEKKVENKIEGVMKEIVPDTVKETVIAMVKEFIAPIFADISLKMEDMENALTVFSRCLALAQENTPEARIAIVQELSSLKLSDQESIVRVKSEIEKFMADQAAKMEELLNKMMAIENTNKQIVEEASEPEPVHEEEPVPEDDGTQI